MARAAESARSLGMEFCWRIRRMLEKSKPLTSNMTWREAMALKSLKNKKQIRILQADKGNCTGPEIGTSSIDWAQLSRFYLQTETEFSLRNIVFLDKDRTMDNVQKYNMCTNVPSSQTFTSYYKNLYSYSLTFLNEVCRPVGAYGLYRFLLKYNGEWR
jgi:hypothetical protein